MFSTRSLGPMYTQLEYLDLQHLDNHGCFNTTILAYRGGSLTCIADYVATYRTDRTRRISPPATHHPLPRLLHPPCPASSLFLTAQRSFGSGSGSTVFLREGGAVWHQLYRLLFSVGWGGGSRPCLCSGDVRVRFLWGSSEVVRNSEVWAASARGAGVGGSEVLGKARKGGG